MATAVESIEELPDVDERLVHPESGYEVIDGVVRFVPPADEPHAERHQTLAVLIGTHAHPDFKVALDMLTRTSKIDDIAPDVSVYPRARNPTTGRRALEHLAFEIVSEQSMSVATTKAAKLVGRGVRRVFAIDIDRARIVEWSRESATWQVLDVRGTIEDPALSVPLSVQALLHVIDTDDDVARALIAKRNAVLEADRARTRTAMIVELIESRGLPIDDEQRLRILAELDPTQIAAWTRLVLTCSDVNELLS